MKIKRRLNRIKPVGFLAMIVPTRKSDSKWSKLYVL